MTMEQLALAGRVVVVVGLGLSGQAAVRLLAARGARVVANDRRGEAELADVAARVRSSGARLVAGDHPPDLAEGADLVVASPGVPPSNPVLAAARARGVPVWGELELGWRALPGVPFVAVTGTNGKSTTTTWTGALLGAAFPRVFVGGNLGLPLCDAAAEGSWDLAVVEVSSFQAETAPSLRPSAAAVLNVTPDHLDRYPDVAAYAAAKALLFRLQGPGDRAVHRRGDPLAEGAARSGRGGISSFGLGPLPPGGAPGAGWDGGEMLLRPEPGGEVESYALDGFAVPGTHNVENLMAAALLARYAGAPPEAVAAEIPRLRPLPHRLEPAGEAAGATWYDDSKATNVDSARASVGGLTGPVVWLLGGRHKGSPYTPLRDVVRGRVRAVVAFGESGDLVARDLAGAGAEVLRVSGLRDAVRAAAALARPGDAVVLSPACSSYDEFRNFEERGRAFRAWVEELP